MAEIKNGYVKSRVAMWGIGISLTLVLIAFSAVFAKSNGNSEKIANTRESQATIIEAVNNIEGDISEIKNDIKELLKR